MSLFGCISRANRAYTAFVIEHEYMYFLYNDQKNLYICRYIKSLDNMEVLNKKTAGKTLRPERIIQFGEGNFLRAFADSEAPYHERKVTLLNGPHTVLSPVAYLSGINIVRDACRHEVIGRYIHRVMFDELMETLNLPKAELEQFAHDVLERFNNPFVDHRLTSIMLNSFPKYRTRDLPGVKVYLARKGKLPEGLVLGFAAMIVYYKGGNRADGTEIKPNDSPEIIEWLQKLWKTNDTQEVAKGVLGATFIWDEDLNHIPGLTALVKKYLDDILEKGMLEAVKELL